MDGETKNHYDERRVVWDYTYNDFHGDWDSAVEGRDASIFGHHY